MHTISHLGPNVFPPARRFPFALALVALAGATWRWGPPDHAAADEPPIVLRSFEGIFAGESGRETRQSITWAAIDLRDPRVEIVVTPHDQRGTTVREFARRQGTEVAVNANYYDSAFAPCGLVAAAGRVWPAAYHHTPAGHCADSVGFTRAGAARFFESYARLRGPLPRGVVNAVTGMPRVLRAGRVIPEAVLERPGYPRNLLASHPRTALGVTRDGRTLVLAVVDGRAPMRDGMTAREAGRWLREIGVHDAVLLDGGGSSVLVTRAHGIVSRPPSDGERTVGVHIGVRLRAP